jgi:hypothetical protein
MKQTITLTFSESVENHTGMEIIGKKSLHGISSLKCDELAEKYNGVIYDLNQLLPKGVLVEDATVLVFKDGLKNIFGIDKEDLYREHSSLEVDKKAFMYGRVVNKNARHNLCYGDKYRAPDYENKMGTIIAFDDISLTKELREKLSMFGKDFENLYAEGNFYYNIEKCYIGFHGDTERSKVIGIRLGESFPLHFRWYESGEKTPYEITIPLNGGDVYIMSEKATGNDWKKRSERWTLRHAAGNKKNLKE